MKIERIILGSQSPRRREYIAYLGYPVACLNPDIHESYPSDLILSKVPEFLAEEKARALDLTLKVNEILITSDTVVILENEIIGKPKDESDAISMLSKLSVKTH